MKISISKDKKMNMIQIVDNALIFECPHCLGTIQVMKNEVNCRIFRHAVYKNTYQPVNPHLPKTECDQLVAENKVIGCCKPFRINTRELSVEKCDYI